MNPANVTVGKHLIDVSSSILQALDRLDQLAADAILFATDKNGKLVGSLTDGDIRRGLLKGLDLNDPVGKFLHPNPKFFIKGEFDHKKIKEYKANNFKIIPVIDENGEIIKIVNFRILRSYLPIDAVIMAGGLGSRLKPLTDVTPKPLLKVGEKAIIQHNVDRILSFGIFNLWITVNYMANKVIGHFSQAKPSVHINFIKEDEPQGTIGAVSKIIDFKHDYILLTNSDILTDLDYEDFFLDFIKNDADLSILSVPYKVIVPYAVLESDENLIYNFKEKPTYTYFSNGGIYLMKKKVLKEIPADSFFNATDLIQKLIERKMKVIKYDLRTYWLDIGNHEDFEKAQNDINHITL